MSIVAGITARKLTNTPAAIFSYPCQSRWFIFKKQIIVLFWVIIYSYLERFFKIGVPGTLYTIHRKTTVSESFFNHPVTCLFFNKRLQHSPFLVDTAKLLRTPLLQEHLETPDSVFIGYICNYNIIKFNVNWPNWLEDVLKTSWSRPCKTSWRRLEDVLKTSWRCITKTNICLYQDVLKTSWRRLLETYD